MSLAETFVKNKLFSPVFSHIQYIKIAEIDCCHIKIINIYVLSKPTLCISLYSPYEICNTSTIEAI